MVPLLVSNLKVQSICNKFGIYEEQTRPTSLRKIEVYIIGKKKGQKKKVIIIREMLHSLSVK